MDEKRLIQVSKKIRSKKDALKVLVEKGGLVKKEDKGFRVVIPPLVHKSSLENKSDKWFFNGFIIDLYGDFLVVDPGVDFYSRFTKTGLDLMNVKTVIVTHGHTDHVASLPVLIEKLLRDKVTKRQFFIPETAFENGLSRYHQDKLKKSKNIELILLKGRKRRSLTLISKHKIEFIPLYHSNKQTFGFKIKHREGFFGHVGDTGYSILIETNKGIYSPESTRGEFERIVKRHKYLKDFYRECNIVAVNMNDLHYNRHSKYHLSGWDVRDLFSNTSVRKLVLLHLSPDNAVGINVNEIYTAFFKGEPYEVFVPLSGGGVVGDGGIRKSKLS